ncbi:sensor histidine kinase [Bogoriella caseilytica]|uniref:histidine kinase n=1 Tax=Bogoriella caseilytica TaxID=56055 RepID=A0A3N2BC07_9MICO|nr:histidine kinase [Bogoriella caseilytica]ROR72775.1 signal transduction histidine kinase [Bogoriella caseilytica]
MAELLQRARDLDQRRPLWWDIGLPVLTLTVCLYATSQPDAVALIALVLLHGAAIFRRRFPFGALMVGFFVLLLTTATALLVEAALPWGFLALWIMLFNLGLREASRSPLWAGIVTAGATGIALAVPVTESADMPHRLPTAVAVLAMAAASYLLGLQIHGRREQVHAQQAEAARAAVVAERSRIAQEMHDIIGHNLSVMTSLATGGAVSVRTQPARAEEAFHAIGATSRSSAREVRRVLSVLRQDRSVGGVALTPPPGVAEVEGLIDSFRTAGLQVNFERLGPLAGLSAGRQLAAYRIVQESLTNTLRHAGPQAGSRVTLTLERDVLAVTVEDDGARIPGAAPGALSDPGSSRLAECQGIVGMRERSEAYGGSLEAGPHGNGWRVRATIPAGVPDAPESGALTGLDGEQS